MHSKDRTDNTRFAFGENWSDYAKTVDERTLAEAKAGLRKLLPDGFDPKEKSFLDIGCGSGLHSIAAHCLGFGPITAVDYDENSVATTKSLAGRFHAPIICFRDDILDTKLSGQFDVVYSWGVLHHTGDMARAIRIARSFVKHDGLLIVAIYRKSRFCNIWRVIKRTYCRSPSLMKRTAEFGFYSVLRLAHATMGNRDYNQRGMNLWNDAVDWLGGYPYQSATPDEIAEIVGRVPLRSFNTDKAPALGLLGTGCAEYTFEAG